MKIGELVKISGLSKDTIRYYEKFGLLCGVTRPSQFNNYKDYSEKNIARLELIQEMKKLGFTLNECKNVIKSIINDALDTNSQIKIINEKLAELEKQISELQKHRDLLKNFLTNKCQKGDILDHIKEP